MMYAELAGNRKRQGIKSPCGNTIDVELGTGRNAEGANGRGTREGMKPRPYLRPAIEDHREEYKHIIQSELKP